MTIAVLLGLSCSFHGTANDVVFRCLTMHIQSLTPGVEDIEVSREVQTAALIGVGLLFSQHWEHSFLVEVMLTEMSRMPSDAHCSHREGYVLGAGYALGLLLLGKGNSGATRHTSHCDKGIDSNDDKNKCNYLGKIEERLLHMIYGSRRSYAEYNLNSVNNNNTSNNNNINNNYFHSGSSAANFACHTFTDNIYGSSTNSDNNDYCININNNNACRYKDVDFYEIYGNVANDGHFLTRALLEERSEEEHNQYKQNQEIPATHFTCTQVHEGNHYNSFISGHAAVMALGFMHLKTNNRIIAQRLAVGHRFVDVQRVTPLLALLRSLMSCLIC